MTPSGVWQEVGAGENLFTRILRFLFLIVAAAILIFLATAPLNWEQQVDSRLREPARGAGPGAEL